uniref:transcription termination/antitermination protein NusG n=1 Tax=Erigeron canadensis TaxID=72917 RepID=UPI001CB99938|nr:transcription termination/antitermination protein NusG [Erigeron canadensis]XP_043629744.1 transcription termination/antitermination protein NusG [Erigeron canadensis]
MNVNVVGYQKEVVWWRRPMPSFRPMTRTRIIKIKNPAAAAAAVIKQQESQVAVPIILGWGEGTSSSSLAAGAGSKEKREMRKEKREEKMGTGYNWREHVEEKLLEKPKKRYNSWKEELNLDLLAQLGPQWWILKVSRAKGKDTILRMTQSLHKNFPDLHFQVFAAVIDEKTKLKSGKISVKPKSLYPGCVFIKCVLNRELHNFIKEDCEGVGGFIGRMAGNTKRKINKPRPVSEEDMEAIFQEVKEKQEAADKAFEEEHSGDLESDKKSVSLPDKKLVSKQRSRKPSGPLLGSNVRIISGVFADFSGTIKKIDKKRGLATVGFTLFGKETIADLNLTEIVEEHK